MKRSVTVVLSGLAAAGIGFLWQGSTAAWLAGGYTAVATRAAIGASAARVTERARTQTLDAFAYLAADLRAGLPPAATPAEALGRLGVSPDNPSAGGADPVQEHSLRRLRVAWHLAERTGAPLADVLDLLVADVRAAQRRRAQAGAQLAGARATAVVLIALPAMGLGMGHAIGGDPLRVLLHTQAGAFCAGAALLLQLLGLFWVNRLVRHAAP